VKHLVADLDEKLSDRGGAGGGSDRRDVEEGGSGSGSSQEEDESASDAEDQMARPPCGAAAHSLPQHRSDSRFE